MRIQAFDYFRAIAILIIVAGHTYGYYWQRDALWEQIMSNLITGGTALFVFISGFFFHYVFYKRFDYADFLIKKTKFVFVPFLVLTVSLIVFGLLYGADFTAYQEYFYKAPSTLTDYFELLIFYLFTKGYALPFWFIPFIMLIFIASPLFLFFIKRTQLQQSLIILITLIVSLLIHRPFDNINPVHSFFYFLPVYLIGIYVSQYRERVMERLQGKVMILLAIVLLLAVFQAVFLNNVGNFMKADPFEYAGIDVILLQKIFLSLFFVALLSRYEDRESVLLKKLADMSFAIFFLHGVVIIFLRKLSFDEFMNSILPGPAFFIINFFVVLSITIAAAYAVKFVFKARSRYIIGW
ncbi:acyltransferase [Thiomicrorhabdus sp.]|uniref:acyltransferase family protein n=1 Tax=Thiomicrorhabdus sp. TaxID=2039724 RepID=UPI00356B4A32